MSDPNDKDHWSPEACLPFSSCSCSCSSSHRHHPANNPHPQQAYAAAAAFVPAQTATLLSYLSAQAHEQILDLGTGDGLLAAHISSSSGARVLGLDASGAMIRAAQTRYAHLRPGCVFEERDCRYLLERGKDGSLLIDRGPFDKVFSNAALHWILRDEATRQSVLRAVHALLRPRGGAFVFEMGGHGNVAEVRTALRAALSRRGVSIQEVRSVDPWWFPCEEGMRRLLVEAGFDVERLDVEWRPTRLSGEGEGGGLEGWVRLMGARFLEVLDEKEREGAVAEVCEVLEDVVRREDGAVWLGYVRLRGVARKG